MRTLKLVPAVLLFGMVACSSGTGGGSSSDTSSSTAMSTDTSAKAADTTAAVAPMMPAPDGAKVFFKNLKDGQSVKSPFKVEMGVSGIALDTAGAIKPNSGHHHLIVDGDSIPMGMVVPKDSTHMHFGKAQTETMLTLAPGKHKLTLQYADGIHRSYGAKLSASVTVDVKK